MVPLLRFKALARLFAQNVRVYAYPMAATDLHEWIDINSVTGWEWNDTNGWMSANQLRHAPLMAISTRIFSRTISSFLWNRPQH